jgi:hypothetical protein
MSQEGQVEIASPRRPRVKKTGAVKRSRAKTSGSKRTSRSKTCETPVPVASERYTPLLTRDAFTISRMRADRGGPHTYTAICFPGWIRA